MPTSRTLTLTLIALLSLAGCVALPREGGPVAKPKDVPRASADFPSQIAILPMNNKAGDADGAMILRALVKRKLETLGYRIQAFDETDQIIRDRTSVGPDVPVQVALAKQDPKVLTAWLGVDGILHGELLAFNRAELSIYTRREVKATFWLTDKQNHQIWQGFQDADNGSFGGGSQSIASSLTGSGIAPDVIDKINRSPLAAATMDLVDETLSTFPSRQ